MKALLKQSLRRFKMSNINPIFSIEYPNLDTLLFIRKQYPQLADMEIGTSIIDEECIIAHYLPDEDKPCQVAEELIYFGTLLASTKHFHRTEDQYDLVYRCVSLRHEAKSERSADDEKIKVKIELPKFERVSQIEVKCDRNDVLTITYPRDETVFSNVDFEARSTYFDLQTVVSNNIRDILKETFGVKLETRLFIGKNNVSFYIFDFNRSSRGTKFTMEKVVSDINGVLLKPEHRGKVEAKEVKAPEWLAGKISRVDMGHSGPYTLEEVFVEIAKQDKSPTGEKPHTGFKPDEVVPLQGGEHSTCTNKQFDAGVVGYIVKEVKPEKFESLLGHVEVSYDGETDQLSITYPYDKTVFTKINVNDPNEYFENIKTISDGVRTIFKREYDFNADTRLLGIKDKIRIYIDDLSKVAERVRKVSGPFDPSIEKAIIEEVIMNVVPKVSSLVLKPQFTANHPN